MRTRVGRSLMPDSSTKTIKRPSRWAFFKRRPSAALPTAHSILVSLNGAFLGLLRAKAHRPQDAPDLRLAKAHAVQAFNEYAHALERPQFRTKSMLSWLLQQRCAQRRHLLLIELGWAPPLRHAAQGVDAAFIEQFLPRVHGLARHPHRQRHFRAPFARQQQSPCLDPLLCRFAESPFCHDHILQ